MKSGLLRSLVVGSALAMLVVLGLPGTATAGQNDPYFSVSSTSYSGQPRTFSVRIINNLENSKLSARISGAGLSSSLHCVPAGAILGLGPWKCTLSGSYRLNPGSFSVTASAAGNGHRSASVTHSGSVSSRFGISGHSSPREGEGFTVSGRYDHISGRSDYRVKATVTGNGSVVAGQSGTSCSASGGSYTCSLRSAAGHGSSYNVTVTEVGPTSRSRSTTVPVVTTAAPSAPAFTGSSKYSVSKQPGSVTGTARSGSVVQVVVDPSGTPSFSSPTATCTAGSSGSWSCPLPKLAEGKHRIAARAIDPTDSTKISAVSFRTTTVTAKPVKTAPSTPVTSPTPVTLPEPQVETPPVTSPVKTGVPAFNGLSKQFSELLLLLVIGLAVSALARPGPLSLVFGGSSASFATEEDAAAGYELALQRGVGIGDNSPTWRALGHDATDYWSRTMPGLLHRYSPFLSRLASDGVDLRAVFGSLWWLFPLGGTALGMAAASDTGGHATVPALGILVTTMVIACFDALAGFLASVVFALLTVGDVVKDKHSALTVLAIGFLWTALPLIATAVRPFRRPGALSWKYSWDRVADLVITALLCGWVAQKIAQTMDLFADAHTGVPAQADKIGLIVVVAIAVRVLLANAVDVWWPERLRQTEIQEDLPEPATSAILAGILVRAAVFAFLGYAFIGTCWQWYAGVALFALPDLLLVVRDWFGVEARIKLPLPGGVTEIFLVVVGCIALIAALVSGADTEQTALRYGFLAAGVIPAVLGSANVFRNPKRERDGSTWDLQLAGAGIVVTLLILGLHGWNF